jgi:hypothetical protein
MQMFGRYLPGTAFAEVFTHAWSRALHTCYTDSSSLALTALDLDAGKVLSPVFVLQTNCELVVDVAELLLVASLVLFLDHYSSSTVSNCRPDVTFLNLVASILRGDPNHREISHWLEPRTTWMYRPLLTRRQGETYPIAHFGILYSTVVR